jgi:hypothetical protein
MNPKDNHIAITVATADSGHLSVIINQIHQAHINYGPYYLCKTQDEASVYAQLLMKNMSDAL